MLISPRTCCDPPRFGHACNESRTIIRAETDHPVHLVSNPEFLKEGSAVEDFLKPDRVVIGTEDEASGQVIRELYLPFVRNQKPIIIMGRTASFAQ